jgi:hypothetical protein
MYINGVQMRFAKDGRVEEVWWSSSSTEQPMARLYLNTRK